MVLPLPYCSEEWYNILPDITARQMSSDIYTVSLLRRIRVILHFIKELHAFLRLVALSAFNTSAGIPGENYSFVVRRSRFSESRKILSLRLKLMAKWQCQSQRCGQSMWAPDLFKWKNQDFV